MKSEHQLKNASVHVMLISAQAAPNLLPALDPDIRPEEAVLLVSEKMKSRGEALEAVLREAGVKASRVPLDNEHDLESLETEMLKIAEERVGQRIALNVTGGTKLMALAAQSVAELAGWEVFYVDVDTDEVIPLDRSKSRRKLATELRLSHYLRAYGYLSEKTPPTSLPDSRCRDLLQTLTTQVDSLEKPLGHLNGLAHAAEEQNRLDISLSGTQKDNHNLETLLRHFEDAGVVRVDGNTLHFTSEANRSFVKGGWLEHYVFRAVGRLSDILNIRDKDINLKLVNNTGVKNELDVVFLARNRLFVIECKTCRLDGDKGEKANDALFKLAEVSRRVGGLAVRAMLASYRPLSEAEKRLARALNIELVCGAELAPARMEEKLKRWVVI